jgi:hypothetical protein
VGTGKLEGSFSIWNLFMELPLGFRFAGVSAAIKKKPNTKDVTLIVGTRPLVAAGVYTTNQVVAAPVVLDRGRTPSKSLRAVVVNSGCANACTGTRGMEDAVRMTELVSKYVACGEKIEPEQVLVMSTGVIGRFLPMQKIEAGISEAAAQLREGTDGFLDAADGIMTTDAFRKVIDRKVEVGGKTFRIAGERGRHDRTQYGYYACLYFDRCTTCARASSTIITPSRRSIVQLYQCGRPYEHQRYTVVAIERCCLRCCIDGGGRSRFLERTERYVYCLGDPDSR